MDAHPDALLLSAFRDLADIAWAWPYLLAVVTACTLAVLRRNHCALERVQWAALGCGLFLTLHGMGSEVGNKVDLRWAFAMLGGVASLYACYACLFAHTVLWMLSRARPTLVPRA